MTRVSIRANTCDWKLAFTCSKRGRFVHLSGNTLESLAAGTKALKDCLCADCEEKAIGGKE